MFSPFFVRFFREEEGQTLVEYGLLISFIALAVITAMSLFGKKLTNYYNNANNQIPTH
jgi:pilus assembly protein Flp/PilA